MIYISTCVRAQQLQPFSLAYFFLLTFIIQDAFVDDDENAFYTQATLGKSLVDNEKEGDSIDIEEIMNDVV